MRTNFLFFIIQSIYQLQFFLRPNVLRRIPRPLLSSQCYGAFIYGRNGKKRATDLFSDAENRFYICLGGREARIVQGNEYTFSHHLLLWRRKPLFLYFSSYTPTVDI